MEHRLYGIGESLKNNEKSVGDSVQKRGLLSPDIAGRNVYNRLVRQVSKMERMEKDVEQLL